MRRAALAVLAPLILFLYKASAEEAQIKFVNVGEQEGTIYFVFDNREHEKKFVGTAEGNGGVHFEDSWDGHRFELSVPGAEPRKVVVQSGGSIYFDVEGAKIKVWGDALFSKRPKEKHEGPRWKALTTRVHAECSKRWEGRPADQAHFCDARHDNRVYVNAKFDHTDETRDKRQRAKQGIRERELITQPAEFRNFTDVGFTELDFDPAIYEKLRAFHASRRLKSTPENMPWDDPNLEGRASETWMAELPGALRREMFHEVRRVLSEWTSVPEADLKEASVFGVRLYHKDSVLNMHIDKRDTHVLSSIVVIGRADADDTVDWPLHIVDHSGRLVKIPARPGQLILYESATCPHGRPEKFAGLEMANAFVHFTPAGWPDAYLANKRDTFLHQTDL